MIEELRLKNDFLISKCESKADTNYIRYGIIKKLLSDDKCFFKISFEDAYNILIDLGYSENDAIDVYKKLVSPEEFSKVNEE